MSSDFYALTKSRAKACLDGIVQKPLQRAPEKTDMSNEFIPIQTKKSKKLLRRKSSDLSCIQKQPVSNRCLSLPTATCLLSRKESSEDAEEITFEFERFKTPFADVLSYQNFSRGKTSIFKLRNASSRFFFNEASSASENSKESRTKKMRSTWSCSSLPSISLSSKDDMQLCTKFSTPSPAGLSLGQLETDLMSSSAEFLRNSPSLIKLDEESDYHLFPPIPGSDSAMSDWRDHFAYPETDSEFNAEKTSLENTDSNSRSYSFTTWSSRSNSRLPKPNPMQKCTLKPKNIPPPGMLLAAWLNTKTGNRFKTFRLDAKLETVINWLGSALPIVVQEPESAGRLCDPNLTIAQALGKMLKNPSQQGIAFFIGPVNSKLSYMMTVCDLCQLSALKTPKDEEKERRSAWV